MRRFVWLAVVVAFMGVLFANDAVVPKGDFPALHKSNLVKNVLPGFLHHRGSPRKSLTLDYTDCVVETVGYTYYDMQHNYTTGRNIAVDHAGGVHIVWMKADDAMFSTRHIHYNYIYPGGGALSTPTTTIPVESSNRGGYCTIALAHLPPVFDTTAAEIEVPFVAFHASYSGFSGAHTDVVWDGIYRILGETARGGFGGTESGSPLPGAGSMPEFAYSNSDQYDDIFPELEECPDAMDIEAIWPVIETGNNGWVYLAATNYDDTNHFCGVEVHQWIVFWSGEPTYDGSGNIQYYDFGSPLLLDLQNGINTDLAYDPGTNTLAAVYYYYNDLDTSYCPDSLWSSLYSLKLYYRTTTDNGVTWSERMPIIEYDDYPSPEQLDTIYDPYVGYAVDTVAGTTTWVAGVDTMEVAYIPWWPGAISAIYDDEGVLHVAFEAWMLNYASDHPYDEDPCGAYMTIGNAICYWNSRDQEIVPVSIFIYGNPSGIMNSDGSQITAYRHSLDPSISIDNEGNLYIAWEQTFNLAYDFFTSDTFLNWALAHAGTLSADEVDEYSAWLDEVFAATEGYLDVSDDGIANEDVYVSMSVDGGRTWGKGYNITQSFSPGCAAGECESELSISMAERVDDALHIFAVLDLDAGQNLRDVGDVTNNPILYIKLPKDTPTFNTIYNRATVGIKEARVNKPSRLAIGAYPNPFNATANIVWSSPVSGNGKVEIVDVTGKVVATLYNGFISTGQHSILWDGTDDSGNPVPSGTYMCRVILGDEIATSKITLLK